MKLSRLTPSLQHFNCWPLHMKGLTATSPHNLRAVFQLYMSMNLHGFLYMSVYTGIHRYFWKYTALCNMAQVIFNYNFKPEITRQFTMARCYQIYIYIYIYAFSRRFYPKRLTLHSSYSFYILSALAFPGNRTHDLGVASAMLYQLSYKKAVRKRFDPFHAVLWSNGV